MKPLMLFAIVMLVAIVIVVSFGLQLAPNAPVPVDAGSTPYALYICPADGTVWDGIANAIQPVHNWLVIALFAAIMLLAFSWGWALYQNLLSDSFKRDSFKKPWQLTKWVFWVAVLGLLVTMTPNHFKTVMVDGMTGEYVLCESDTPGAVAVRYDAVHN